MSSISKNLKKELDQDDSIDFGAYKIIEVILDHEFHDICKKIRNMVSEIGKDPCGRRINAQEIVFFAIDNKITNLDIDQIYRKMVHQQISVATGMNIEQLEIDDLIADFEASFKTK